MRALVVGLGSAGQRHLRVLTALGLDCAGVSRRTSGKKGVFRSLADGIKAHRPNYIVIATETSTHFEVLDRLKKECFKGKVMVEKPLFSQPKRFDISFFEAVYIGYNLRFHPAIQEMHRALQGKRVLSAHGYIGQYLPDWRPDTDYRKCYSAARALGGGVLRDLSHELDYLFWMLGPWRKLVASGGHFSALKTDCEDIYGFLMATQRCPLVTLQLNCVDRVARRELVVNTSDNTFKVDLISGSFSAGQAMRKLSANADETCRTQREAILNAGGEGVCNFLQAQNVLKAISAAEKSAAKGVWVKA